MILFELLEFFELCFDLWIKDLLFPGHDHPISDLFTPTRQHEGMDVQFICNILDGDTIQFRQSDDGRFEVLRVLMEFS